MDHVAFADYCIARLAVHFESIKETFTPYDTIFTFAEAYELSDSTLSSTCSLHTAASFKSLRSSPTQNLAGVKEEDGSESGTVRGPGSEAGTIRNSKIEAETREDVAPTEKDSSPRPHDEPIAKSSISGTPSPRKAPAIAPSITIQGLRPRTASDTDKDLPPTPGFSSKYLSRQPESTYDREEFGPRSSIDTRISSSSARPSLRELNKAYDYNRPKVKVGPRPSMDSTTHLDTTHGIDQDVRPVASLPSGVRMSARKAVPPRPSSQQSPKKLPLQIPKIPSQGSTPAPPPVTPTNPTHPPNRIPLGPDSGLPSTGKNSDVKSPKMTPEKRRLMKALQIRQKHLAAQNAAGGRSNDTIEEDGEIKKVQEDSHLDEIVDPSVNRVQEPQSQKLQAQEPFPDIPQPEDPEPANQMSREVQDSPVSAPDPSDGPSTQASSITEEEVPIAHRKDVSEVKMIPDDHQNRLGLEDIIIEQTQGPVIAIESSSHDPPENPVQHPPPITFASHEDKFTPPPSTAQGQSNRASEDEHIGHSVQTASTSSTSSEHTMTDQKITPPAKIEESTEAVLKSDTAEAQRHGSNSTERPKNVPLHLLPTRSSKQADEDVSALADIEEPESPLLIEGHSVQTSASPSVVNLLDGLAATTHNESTASARDIENVESTQAQEPSLFNMVGGFGGSGESPEAPLSAVREEAEISPSPRKSDNQALQPEHHLQNDRTRLKASAKDHGQSGDPDQSPGVGDVVPMTMQAPTINVKRTSTVRDASPTEAPAAQKTRPRTTSKTFQFPSKSRSSSRGDKPTSLDMSKATEPMPGGPEFRLSHISSHSVNKPQNDMKPTAEQERPTEVQPEAPLAQQSTTGAAHSSNANPDKQPSAELAGMPVTDALSHASSKALKLLGLSADQPESRPDGRAESTVGTKERKEVTKFNISTLQTEAKTEAKPDAEAEPDSQPKLLPEGRSEGFLDVHPDVPSDESPTQPRMNDSLTSNLTKAIEEDKQTDRQARRRGVVEPVKRISTPEQSDEQFLSDDSFMEELKTATVQEAKPISVSRSPIKPGFLGSEHDLKAAERGTSRTLSSPLESSNTGERSASATRPSASVSLRSFSGTIPPRPDVKTPPGPQSAQPKKFGVSSGISQRIKALEVKSSRPNSPNLPTPTTPGFLNLRKPSFNSELNGAFSRSRASTAYPSPQTSPEVGKLDPLNRSVTPRGESVSVTATIVRDPVEKSPWPSREPSNTPTVNLHESPLVVERQIVGPYKQQVMGPPPPPQFSPLKPPRPRYSRYSSARSASSSSTEQKADGMSHSRRGSTASKRSARSSRNGSEVDLPRALSDRSLNSSSQLGDIKEEKKGSRSSRLLKRMSSFTSISRRSIAQAISPSPREGSIMERSEPIAETPAVSAIDMGDINIQFPDTLLWKRRHMTINEDSILELSASKADNVGPRKLSRSLKRTH